MQYKSYPSLPQNTETLMSMSLEQLEALDQEIVAVRKHNDAEYNRVYSETQQKIKDITELFNLKGIAYKEETREKRGRSRFARIVTKEKKWYRDLYKDLQSKVVNAPSVYFGGLTYTLNDDTQTVFRYDRTFVLTYQKIKNHIEKVEAMKHKESAELRIANEILSGNGVKIEAHYTEKDIKEKALDLEFKRLTSESMGQEMSFSQCDYCNKYVLGERRCSCGNRRVSYFIDGDLLTGVYLGLEAY